jgi:putative transposase
MLSEPSMEVEAALGIRTLRLKVKPEARAWLNAAAVEVNRVWNYANETSAKAARPFAGTPKWLSAYDLDKLTAGSSACFGRIGSETIQRVNAEFATRRKQFKKVKLRWRSSHGSRRALGWIPFKAVQLKRKGKSLRFSGKALRVFEQDRRTGVRSKSGCFSQDSVGHWWLSVPVEYSMQAIPAESEEVGLDLDLRETVATSDGDKLEAGHFYRHIEQRIARAPRHGHKRQAKRLHQVSAISRAAEPGTLPAQSRETRSDGGVMNTGSARLEAAYEY